MRTVVEIFVPPMAVRAAGPVGVKKFGIKRSVLARTRIILFISNLRAAAEPLSHQPSSDYQELTAEY